MFSMEKKMQRAITQKIRYNFFFLIFTRYLLIILYQLTKYEALSCDSFWDIFIAKLHYDSLKGA